MSFELGEHGKMVEMFAECPDCQLSTMIIYEDGSELCTYCGHSLDTKVSKR